ncbi:MAG: [FeFe] hydrogenase H-cluster radical SAM maturase HydE [Lachnospiraceae bacterium]|nr:[FeFe] hydrogenase H-cluster radical SAM maturase HydE [Lachnospiraceae bacterium]
MGQCMTEAVDKLLEKGVLPENELVELLRFRNPETTEYLLEKAAAVCESHDKRSIRVWGRIPLTSYCKNDCNYCGLRRSNQFVPRFRLTEQDVLRFCEEGYRHGIRHVLLEGGTDLSYSEDTIAHIIGMIRRRFHNMEIILALGEHIDTAYRHWMAAGAGAYLMPQDAVDDLQFKRIHSSNMSLLRRKQHMWSLQNIGYQVGAGFLVGTPYQTIEQVAKELLFMKQFGTQMITVAPFLPAQHTPFERERSGNAGMVLYLISVLRLMAPKGWIVADLSMEEAQADGRIQALSAGANVVVMDLTAGQNRIKYQVYNDRPGRREKEERLLVSQIRAAGYQMEQG